MKSEANKSLKYEETGRLLRNYFEALVSLKHAGITSNKKDFTSQIGEWLVSEIYGGILANNAIQKDWDLEVGGKKIQVKTHAKAYTNKNKFSEIKYNINAEIDELIIVIFTEDYVLREFYQIPWNSALPIIRSHKFRDVILWNHIKEFKRDLTELPNQEIVELLRNHSPLLPQI